jgi:hypothetical protein
MVVDPSRTGYLTAVDYCNRPGSAAARLNQSDIVFIFSIRLEPTKNFARGWLVPNARHVRSVLVEADFASGSAAKEL